jgi:hypothetical protein
MIDILNKNNKEIASAKLQADAFSLLTEAVITQLPNVAITKIFQSLKRFVEFLDSRIGIGINSSTIVTVNSYVAILEKTFELTMNRHRDKVLLSQCKRYEKYVTNLRDLVQFFMDGMYDHFDFALTTLGCKNNIPAATVSEIERVNKIQKQYFGVNEADKTSEITTRLIKFRLGNKPLSNFKDEDLFTEIPLIRYAKSESEIDQQTCDYVMAVPTENHKAFVYTNYFVEERNGINLLKISLEAMREILMRYPDDNPTVRNLVKIKYDLLLGLNMNEYIEKLKAGQINLSKDFQTIVNNLNDIAYLVKSRVIRVENYKSVRMFLAGVYCASNTLWDVLNPEIRSDVYGDKTLVIMWEAKFKVYEDNEEYVSTES